MISELTRQRLARFRRIRRAHVSFWVLLIAYGISLFSELVAYDKPILLRYEGQTYFPSYRFYSAATFGGAYKTEADYIQLEKDPAFMAKGGWMLFPIIRSGPYRTHLDMAEPPPHPPSREHWLGTDNIARDVASRLIHGFRICMTFSLVLSVLSTLYGILLGGIQGYLGAKTDLTMQRLIEVWGSLPFLYVVILLGSIYGRSIGLLLFIMLLFEWIGLSYYIRGEFFKVKNLNYVRVARAVGLSHRHIFFHEILPNAMTPAITIFPFKIIGGITALTALDFLGFGLQPPTPSWGEMLSQGLENIHKPWIALSAVGAQFLTLLLATFVGEGIREAFDPKSEHRFE